MKHCPSCGGIIDRDCFNPIECAQITERLAVQHDQNHYEMGRIDGIVSIVENPSHYELTYGNNVKILITGVNVKIFNAVNGYGDNCKDEITLTELTS